MRKIINSLLFLLLFVSEMNQTLWATDTIYHLHDKGQKEILLNHFSAIHSSVEFDVVPQNSHAQVGVLFRYISPENWVYVGCDKATDHFGFAYWYVQTPNGKTEIARDIAKLYAHHLRHIKINCAGKTITVYVDGEQIAHTYIPNMPEQSGKTGFRIHEKGNAILSNITCNSIEERKKNFVDHKDCYTLQSAQMDVLVDKKFPSVYRYTWKKNQAHLSGQSFNAPYITVNGNTYRPTVKSRMKDNKVMYTLYIKEINVTLQAHFEVVNNILAFHITDIQEQGSQKVNTLAFPNHHLASTLHTEPEACLSIANNVSSDIFYPLKKKEIDPTYRTGSILLLNTRQLTATLESNSIYNTRQFLYQSIQTPQGKRTGIWGNEWIYRGHDGKVTEQPYIKVILADDRNADGKTDWQDGAMALQETYPKPAGLDMLQNSYATITMNFASGAQYPFLRQLDNIKKFYLATDGFGQMLELKGYQSEGHDSGHPDYAGNYNQRAGGLADFSLLVEEAKKYNAHIGVHINHSEAYPEARAFNDRIVTDMPGWSWLDQAYFINKEADIEAGTFESRLNQLKADVPSLAFIYIDTYREYRWIAHHTAKLFHKNGWAVWTEDADVFDKEALWIHYNPEAGSLIHRFVHHQYRDGYRKHPALLGGYNRGAEIGFMGWQRGRDFPGVLRSFFMQQLPYRYLMHFPVTQLDSVRAVLANGLEAYADDKGQTILRKGNRELMRGTAVFIPWNPATEEKIYHYNIEGGKTIWQLPESWKENSEVYLYQLSDQGRTLDKKLSVLNHQIEIDALPETGYVVYKQNTSPAAMEWSTGSPVKDMGFDSESFAHWKREGHTESVSITRTDYGQSQLSIQGKKEAGVQQVVDGLRPGQEYVASVWVCVDGQKQAKLGIQTGETQHTCYTISESNTFNYTNDTDRFKTRWQRMKVAFRAPSGTEKVILSLTADGAESDTATVSFDDIRIVAGRISQKEGYACFEDFENVDEGWGPFIAAQPGGKTHLSQRHDVYTENTIHGDWSLTTWRERDGEVYRTSPAMIQFKSQQAYEIEFNYKTDTCDVYKVVGYSPSLQNEVFSYELNRAGQCHIHFTTPDCTDFYIAIIKAGKGLLVIDDFGIKGELRK